MSVSVSSSTKGKGYLVKLLLKVNKRYLRIRHYINKVAIICHNFVVGNRNKEGPRVLGSLFVTLDAEAQGWVAEAGI